jgi:peptidoglycan/xylan/chitin deacetylase (PgdA/CDA1 family)
MLLVVMYHYIREKKTNKGIYPITPYDFEKQLDLLGKHFKFISISELIEIKKSNPKGDIDENYCLITFDDGLREQYETAWPILKTKGIPAVFFVCTKPLLDGEVLRVHKIHHIRSMINHSDIENSFSKVFKDKYSKELKNIDSDLLKKTYRYDSEDEAYLKYLLNYVLSERDVDKFVDYLYEKYVGLGLEHDALDIYMTEEQIIELSKYDAIGSHTMSHRPLSKMDLKEAAYELSESKKTLDDLTNSNTKILAISYPYGGPAAVTKEVAKIAEKIGYEIGFTTERSFNKSFSEPLLLARADTNDVPGGKSPQFEYIQGALRIRGNFNLKRMQWVTEQ